MPSSKAFSTASCSNSCFQEISDGRPQASQAIAICLNGIEAKMIGWRRLPLIGISAPVPQARSMQVSWIAVSQSPVWKNGNMILAVVSSSRSSTLRPSAPMAAAAIGPVSMVKGGWPDGKRSRCRLPAKNMVAIGAVMSKTRGDSTDPGVCPASARRIGMPYS